MRMGTANLNILLALPHLGLPHLPHLALPLTPHLDLGVVMVKAGTAKGADGSADSAPARDSSRNVKPRRRLLLLRRRDHHGHLQLPRRQLLKLT